MEEIYYIAINGKQEGPFSREQLASKNLTADTLVWKPGLPEWAKASNFEELAEFIVPQLQPDEPPHTPYEEERIWFAMLGNNRIGPLTLTDLIGAGINRDTPVWKHGMSDWAPAFTSAEIMERLQPTDFAANPQYGNNPQYGDNPQYGNNPYYGSNRGYGNNSGYNPQTSYGTGSDSSPFRTNWLPWAIGATVVGLLFSCIGVIFGIIAIVQANKANRLYLLGYNQEGDRVNGNARLMTIIAYILAGVGLIAGIVLRNVYSNLIFNY